MMGKYKMKITPENFRVKIKGALRHGGGWHRIQI
jgi:hypothetical protein